MISLCVWPTIQRKLTGISSTISLPATVSIILNGAFLTSLKATVREFYEIENPKQAFERMIKRLVNEDLLPIEIITDIHADLTNRW